jgi:hypothetical protein
MYMYIPANLCRLHFLSIAYYLIWSYESMEYLKMHRNYQVLQYVFSSSPVAVFVSCLSTSALFATILSLCFRSSVGDPTPNPHQQQVKLCFCKCL